MKAANRKAAIAPSPLVSLLLGDKPAVGLFVLKAPAPNPVLVASSGEGAAAPAQEPAQGDPQPPAAEQEEFVLLFVDGEGYLQTVQAETNPWHSIAEQLRNKRNGRAAKSAQSEAAKLALGQKYRLYLVAHPDVRVARRLHAYLNAKLKEAKDSTESKDLAGEPGAAPPAEVPWPDPAKAVELVAEVVSTKEKSGKSIHKLDLPDTAGKYWPGCPGHHEGWLLFRDMPYAHLEGVERQVRQLAVDLAALRYPVTDDGGIAYPRTAEQYVSGRYGLNLMATVHQFQVDVAEKRAFQVAAWARQGAALDVKTSSCAELLGNPVTLAPEKPASEVVLAAAAQEAIPLGDAAPRASSPAEATVAVKEETLFALEDVVPGAVDPLTAAAISEWKERRLRRAGAVVVEHARHPKNRATSMRPELAFAFLAWDELAVALGCPYGVKAGHTFRELDAPGGEGRAQFSNHKLGLAVDVSFSLDETYGRGRARRLADYFPVMYEANWVPGKSWASWDERATLDKAKAELAAARDRLAKRKTALATKVAEHRGLTLKLMATPGDKRAKAQAKLASQQAEIDALKTAVSELEEKVKTGEGKTAELEQALRREEERIKVAKSDYRLRWRLYGHSTLPVFSLSAEALAAKLAERFDVQRHTHPSVTRREGELAIVASYRARLHQCFPQSNNPERDPRVEAIIRDAVADFERAVTHLLRCARDGSLRDGFFRKEIWPFDYDPWDADGGTTRKTPLGAGEDARKLSPRLFVDPYAPRAAVSCWVNMTRLAYLVGLWRIGARRSEFKLYPENPDASSKKLLVSTRVYAQLGPVGKGTERTLPRQVLMRAIAEQIELAFAKRPSFQVLVRPAKGAEVKTYKLADFDLALMKSWPPDHTKLPKGVTIDGLDLVVALSADGKVRTAQEELFSQGLPNVRFRIESVGKDISSPNEPGEVHAGRSFATQVFRHAILKPDTTKARLKSPTTWSFRLRPLLVSDGCDLWQASITLPRPGGPRALEWWHYEHKSLAKSSWPELAAEIGYSEAILSAPEDPPPTPGGAFVRGCGCNKSKPSPAADEPENHSINPEGG